MKKWLIFIICLVLVFAAAFVGSIFTSGNTSGPWYEENKPSFTPPNFVFPIVWNILYFLIALSLFLAWTNSNKKQKKKVAIIFAVNLILNALWSFLFFSLQNPLLAFIDLSLIWLTILLMLYVTIKINKISFYLLIPYLLWVTFAGVLNAAFVV